MTHWIETYRGAVPPWQCDVTEHFTISYYFDRIEEAEANFAEALGLPDPARHADAPRQIDARFVRELRAGASFHVESALLGLEHGLRLGHRVVDSDSGEVVTWFQEQRDPAGVPLTDAHRTALAGRIADWTGPAVEVRPNPASITGCIPTARGRVKPGDVNAAGNFSLGAIVHRFSNASGQLGCAIGMNAAFMQSQRRGFSTFELILRTGGALPLDAPYLVETGIALLGNSSMRMIHRMTDPRSGREITRMSQYGVILDLDARRPARWPDDIRARAQPLVVPLA
jgi:acyl-CoA thioesterase FadM